MGIRDKAFGLAMIAGLMMGGLDTQAGREFDDSDYTPLTDEQIQRLHVERLKAKGLKEFWINGECIIALNQKSAQKKYNKKISNPCQ